MIKLLAQLTFIDQIGKRDMFGSVNQAEGHLRIRLVAEN